MGFLGSIFGAQSNAANGAGYKAGSAPTSEQIQGTYDQVNQSFGAQKDFATLAGQQGGFQNQSNVFGQMQGFANQLQDQANGNGPNPALAQLNQTTGQNIASQASLAGSQRGAGANVGLMSRNIGQQGAATQQQAASQAAIMKAQQQLAAQQALQQQQGMMAGVAGQQIGAQQGAITGMGNIANAQQQNVLGMQSDTNKVNSQIALANAKSQAGLVGGILGSFGSGVQSMADGGQVKQQPQLEYKAPQQVLQQQPVAPQMQQPNQPQSRTARIMGGYEEAQRSDNPMQQGLSKALKPAADYIKQGASNLYDAVMSGSAQPPPLLDSLAVEGAETAEAAGTAASAAAAEEAAAAASTAAATEAASAAAAEEGGSAAILALAKGGSLQLGEQTDLEKDYQDPTTISGTLSSIMSNLAQGGNVKAMISPGEIVLNRKEAASPKKAALHAALKEKYGKKVPGKAKVKGDSLKNDTVKANLEEGGIVVPRSHSNSPEAAARFAYACAMKNQKGKK